MGVGASSRAGAPPKSGFASSKYVYAFGGGEAEGGKSWLDVLGSKGSGLHEMSATPGLSVPPGFTIATTACEKFESDEGFARNALWVETLRGLGDLERKSGKSLFRAGCSVSGPPLLLSARSGAAASMPGMMETVLNIGLSDECVEKCLALGLNARWVYDSYRRLLAMFGDVVLEIPKSKFDKLLTRAREETGAKTDADLSADALKKLCDDFKRVYTEFGCDFPQDAREQLRMSIEAVLRSWNNPRAKTYREINRITGLRGTAVNVQQMVFGNLNENSGSGVCFTRDPATGSNEVYGEWLPNSQGEEVVAGTRTPQTLNELKHRHPNIARELKDVCRCLETTYKNMMDIEFTFEDDTLYILQCRVGKRTGHAAIRIATEMVGDGIVTEEEALKMVKPEAMEQCLHPVFVVDKSSSEYTSRVLAKGLPASPGAAVGAIVFSANEAVRYKSQGKPCILVREDTSPDDVGGMHVAEGFVTARGGMTSHAAVVARGWGRPCVVGCSELTLNKNGARFGHTGSFLRAGTVISINGTTGEILSGKFDVAPSTMDTFLPLRTLTSWIDKNRRLDVRANADTSEDARCAFNNGASGVGLVRTEHMFFGSKERVHAIRQLVLAQNVDDETEALEKLVKFQHEDFKSIFQEARGKPVCVRLLDPPLHEFLPSGKTLEDSSNSEDSAAAIARYVKMSPTEVIAAVDAIREQNPMLGFRGCRLGCARPAVTRAQVRAFLNAAIDARAQSNVEVCPEIMVPLVSFVEEFENQRDLIQKVFEEVNARELANRREPLPDLSIGAMIETPRAALIAGHLCAAGAKFFSFGTNDLTQMTLGFSRDDSSSFVEEYKAQGILQADPFETLDAGVAELIAIACSRARRVNPAVQLGICGEHAGDAKSIQRISSLADSAIDYVSVSPNRVLPTRLAAAQAVADSASDDDDTGRRRRRRRRRQRRRSTKLKDTTRVLRIRNPRPDA